MDLIAGRYEPVPAVDGGVCSPARDTISGELVTVLRTTAAAEALTRFQELDRLRRYAGSGCPQLARIRAVELLDGEFRVVCDPLTGVVLEPGVPPAGLGVAHVRQIAAGLLDAVAALHLAGVPRGWVRPGAVVIRPDAPGAAVTLLPLPLRAGGVWWALWGGGGEEERQRAATLLLRLLRGTEPAGAEDEADARRLARALVRAGGTAEQAWGPAGSALFPPVHRRDLPVPLGASPLSLAPLPPVRHPVDEPAPPVSPPVSRPPAVRTRRRPSRRAVLEASAAAIALGATVAVVVAAVIAGSPGGRHEQPAPTAARSAVTTPAAPASAASTAPSAVPTPSPWDLPTTVPALVSALSPRPEGAGPSGPLLLDALRGLMSADPGAARQSALRLVTLVVDDPGVDPRYGAAGLVALAAGAIPGAPDTPPSCFGVAPGAPDPVVQQDAEQVLDRLAGWQAQGLPQNEVDRLRGLAAPVAEAQAVPTLVPCTTG